MGEYWKSTPSYWCKFCSSYVRDTGLERKNHEASGKHQNAIQRSLRNLQKGKEREDRDQQRAKDEVARLNGLVEGKSKDAAPASASVSPTPPGLRRTQPTASAPVLSREAQRRAHAEQLAALGVELPEQLKREVMGVGGWQTVSERVIYDPSNDPKSSADIKAEGGDEVNGTESTSRGVRKREAEDEEEHECDAEAAYRRRAWGNSLKTYLGAKAQDDTGDLDALLNGVAKKTVTHKQETEVPPAVKSDAEADEDEPCAGVSATDVRVAPIKEEAGGGGGVKDEALPAVIFKKRKVKR